MKKLFLLFSLVLSSFVVNNAQQSPPPPRTEEDYNRNLKRMDDYSKSVDALRNVDKPRNRKDPNEEFRIMQSKIKPLYRNPTDEELKLLAPAPGDLDNFADFLREKNTGLIKLIADQGCNKGIDVLVSTPHCAKYSMPGAGSSYSFRHENYRLKHLGDLNFAGKSFKSSEAILNHGIMVNIGNIPIEEIDMQNKVVRILAGFEPVKDFEKAAAFAAMLEKGVEDNGFVYGSNLRVKENSTYLMRSIAYNGESYRVVDEVEYNEFDFDKRKDIIVAFRVVRFNPDESVTIVWKELQRKDSPKIKK